MEIRQAPENGETKIKTLEETKLKKEKGKIS